MHSFSGIRLRKTALFSLLALALASTLAACGGAVTATGATNTSGATTTSTTPGACKNHLASGMGSIGLIRSDNIGGHIRYLFSIGNDGSSPCTLEGYPMVTVADSTITVIPTTSADTWSNVAIAPITLAPNDFVVFALQGHDETTNCKMVQPSIAPPQDPKGADNSSTVTVCGGKLYVSPMVYRNDGLNK